MLVACLGLAGSARAPRWIGGAPPASRTDAAAFGSADAPQHGGATDGSVIDMVARLANFGILAGMLYVLLRTPIGAYLRARGAQVRADLAQARTTRVDAAQQLEEIDRRLRTLPGELDALKARGARDVAAEQARLERATDAERQRLLAQSRRELDRQLRLAKRELLRDAAELTVGVATERIRENLTDIEHARLVDRYVDQLRPSMAGNRGEGQMP